MFKNYPIAIGGLSLGILSLGLGVGLIFPALYLWAAIISGSLGIILLIPLFLKFSMNPHQLRAELSSSYTGSLLPTMAMAIMIVGYDVLLFNRIVGISIWLLGLGLHVMLVIGFIILIRKQLNLISILPSWFIPTVGILVACVTMPSTYFSHVLKYVFYEGLLAFVILFPIILFRLIFAEKLREEWLSSICIINAPANLCLISYLVLFPHPNVLLTMFLFAAACITALFVYVTLPTLLSLRFTPGHSSLTFPLILSAAGTFKFIHYAQPLFLTPFMFNALTFFCYVQLALSAIIVVVVFYNYLKNWRNF